MPRILLDALVMLSCLSLAIPAQGQGEQAPVARVEPAGPGLLATEKVFGDGIWADPAIAIRLDRVGGRVPVKVWFDEQLLGDGAAYRRRAAEFQDHKRSELRLAAMQTLKALSERTYAEVAPKLEQLVEAGQITGLERHWIINGVSCEVDADGLAALRELPRVKKIFLSRQPVGRPAALRSAPDTFTAPAEAPFEPGRFKHPWYIRALQADRVWRDFEVAGQGTLNVIHDFNFVFSDNVTRNLHRDPGGVPGNEQDDDGNGLVDDYHGYNFAFDSPLLTTSPLPKTMFNPQRMHGYMCAAIVCATGTEQCEYEFGIAPRSTWSGVIAGSRWEAAMEWAIEQGADTYSMSFSMPNLGEFRSHWRKAFEHGSLCGVYFVSGAGNFAQSAPEGRQMRNPEDVPDVVFAAAGVQRNFQRTPFSSKGPVVWDTEHYSDGEVQKPEVCAFNMGLPVLLRDGSVRDTGLNGNSFAGPMFCGAIALMLSADPDLLPWDLKEIITSTATDVGPEGVDYETGHGLINCYLAVKETLRRKAEREGRDASKFARQPSDVPDLDRIAKQLASGTRLVVARVQPRSQAAKVGLRPGDVIQRYNGVDVASRGDLLAAKAEADEQKEEQVDVHIQRGEEALILKFAPGPLGFIPASVFTAPVFE